MTGRLLLTIDPLRLLMVTEQKVEDLLVRQLARELSPKIYPLIFLAPIGGDERWKD